MNRLQAQGMTSVPCSQTTHTHTQPSELRQGIDDAHCCCVLLFLARPNQCISVVTVLSLLMCPPCPAVRS